MDQKVMELLAKIYQTQTEMRSELKELRTDQETIAQNVDFREIQIDHNQKTGQTLERIEAKVEVK